MELLTSSQRQLLLDFKERVRQHETKMKSLTMNKQNIVTLGNEDSQEFSQSEVPKTQTFEPNQLLLQNKSPEREINPNSVLKTIVFNSTPSGVKKHEASPSPGQFKSTSYYPVSDENRYQPEKEKSRILVEDQFEELPSKLDISQQNDKRDGFKNEREDNLSKIYFQSSPPSRFQDDSKFFTNESYSEKLDNYLKTHSTTNQSRIQRESSNSSFTSKPRLQVQSLAKPDQNLSLNTSNTYENRYKAFQAVEEETKANFLTFIPKVGSNSTTNLVSKSVTELAKPVVEPPKSEKPTSTTNKSASNARLPTATSTKSESKPKDKRSNSASQRPKTATHANAIAKPNKKVSFDESHKKPEYVTTKTTDGRNEANRIANDLFRRWKLGTVNQKKLKDIFEDQMFFSTRFLENIKSLLKEKI